MKKLHILTLLAILWSLLIHSVVLAGVDPVNKGKDRKAIHGYDPVAYFTEGRPLSGNDDHEYEWMGALWHFSSAKNLALFAQKPEAYAPQFGGYCAYAVGNNYTANGDPLAWSIVDGKLYLNYSKSVRKQWLMQLPDLITKGEQNWPKLLGE